MNRRDGRNSSSQQGCLFFTLIIAAPFLLIALFGGISISNDNHIMEKQKGISDVLTMHADANNKRTDSTVQYPFDVISAQIAGIGDAVRAQTQVKCGNRTVNGNEGCYDIIVVGAGASGAVMTEKLSRNGTYKVLLLEAGADRYGDAIIQNSSYALATSFGYYYPHYFWPGTSVRQYQLPGSPDFRYTNGRLSGGGTAVNTQMHLRPTIEYWDKVDALTGSHGTWSAAAMTAVMARQENFNAHGHFTPTSRGTTGVLSCHTRPVNSSADGVHLIGVMETAFPSVARVNDVNAPGFVNGVFEKQQLTQRHEVPGFPRETSVIAFLGPDVMDQSSFTGVGGRNLHYKTKSTLMGLLFDPLEPTKCIGVTYIDLNDGKPVTRNAYATKSVVLSTGIHDAAILQRAGIGPVNTLNSAGVPVRVANEHVGRHWKNHVGTIYSFSDPNVTGASPDDGFTGDNLGVGGAYLPDPSIHGSPTERGFQWIFINSPSAGAVAGVFLVAQFQLHPKSEGTIDIQSADPNQVPLVDFKQLTDPTEIESHRESLREFVANVTAADSNIAFLSGFNVTDDGATDAFIYSHIQYSHHWSCATRMGVNSSVAALDWRTRVFGTKGLRVCSASIFPEIPDGNTGVPSMAIGDVCADLLIADIAAGQI